MALIVQKFGGTSVGTTEKILQVAKKIKQFHENGDRLVIVVSAMSGETNKLVDYISQMSNKPNQREVDVVLSTGEQVTIGLLAIALNDLGIKAKSYTGWQVAIQTDASYTKARIEHIDINSLNKDLDDNQVIIVAGFQGVDKDNNITTLGRGGSDTTAVALAAALKADEYQIYTDVDGVYTTDPRVEPKAKKLNTITFEEMLEMASLGSKVLQIRSVEFAGKYNVPLRVLHAHQEGKGTLITYKENGGNMEQPLISGIAFSRDEAKITVEDVKDAPGFAYQVLGTVADANIEVDMIVQNVSYDGITDITFTLSKADLNKALDLLQENINMPNVKISGNTDIAKVSIVGVGMRSHAGVASKMFKALAKENINIQMISTSEIKISVIIEQKYLELAVRSLHEEFNLAY